MEELDAKDHRMKDISKYLKEPVRPHHFDGRERWLSGEGAGSWFLIEKEEQYSDHYKVVRFSPDGIIECQGVFEASKSFDINKEFKLTFPSHCALVTVIQNRKEIRFIRKD